MKKGGKNKKNNLGIILIISAGVLFLFFILPCFHNWANNLKIKLHFCNHIVCVIYSLIWLVFAIIGVYSLIKKNNSSKEKKENKKMGKSWIFIYIIVLIIGIILMNVIHCDSSGKMGFGFNLTLNQKDSDSQKKDFSNDNFYSSNSTWISDILSCTDTDGGLVPEIRGEIYGFADGELTSTGNQDTCHSKILHELYCEDDNYFFVDIDCREYYESDFAYCEQGVCKLGEEINCQETCTFYGFSNARGPFINCSKCDPDEFCDIFINSEVVVYEDTPIHCCCSNEATEMCSDYATENEYSHWTITNEDCEDVASINCNNLNSSLERYHVKFIEEGQNCCVWDCHEEYPGISTCERIANNNECDNWRENILTQSDCEDIFLSDCGWMPTLSQWDSRTHCCIWYCGPNKTVENCTDDDGDGDYVQSGCGTETDCDDTNPNINRGVTENCTDGFDNNCNELIDCDDYYCKEQEICKIPCEESEKPACGGYCPEDYSCKYSEGNDCCYCEFIS